MRTTFVALLFLFLLPETLYAQHKPVCGYSPTKITPAWMVCGSIGDTASATEIEAAYQKSISDPNGFYWILQLGYHDHPLTPADVVAKRAEQKFAKLLPYVVAISYGEEWVESFYGNKFAQFGFPATTPGGADKVRAYISWQNFLVKKVLDKPTIWITHIVSPWTPVPDNIDIVAIDSYMADNDPESMLWAQKRLVYAQYFTHLPIVVIPRFFRVTGPKQGAGWQAYSLEPTKEIVDMYIEVFQSNPQYIAMWMFLWDSRPWADLVGMKDMPVLKAYFESKLR